MKELFFLLFTALLLIPTGTVYGQPNLVTEEQVEEIIDERLEEETPLTEEELTRALLDAREEKIANLEGNISTLIGTAAWFVAGAGIVLAIITGFIGWIVNNSIDKKLKAIEEKETDINSTKTDINTQHTEIKGFHQEIKNFRDKVAGLERQLEENSSLLEKRNQQFKELCKYIMVTESATNSALLVHKFMDEKSKVPQLIHETESLLEQPVRNLVFVITKLNEKTEDDLKFQNVEEVKSYLNDLQSDLAKSEKIFSEMIQDTKTVEKMYEDYDENEDQLLYEEMEDGYNNWKYALDTIQTIKSHWEQHLQMNPPSQKGE